MIQDGVDILKLIMVMGMKPYMLILWKINVKKGQRVKRGDKIGKSGNSGRAAGFHLHYEVHKNNKTVDPLKYFFTGYID